MQKLGDAFRQRSCRHATRAKGNDTAPPTLQQAETETTRAVPYCRIWFNNRPLLGPIGNIPPAGVEACYFDIQEEPAWRRDSDETGSGNPGGP